MINSALLRGDKCYLEFSQAKDGVNIHIKAGAEHGYLTCSADDLFRIYMCMAEKTPTWNEIHEHGGNGFFYKNGYHLKEDDYVPKHKRDTASDQ